MITGFIDQGFQVDHHALGSGRLLSRQDVGLTKHGSKCVFAAKSVFAGLEWLGFPFDYSKATPSTMLRIFTTALQAVDILVCCWSYPPGYYPLNPGLFSLLHHASHSGGVHGKGCLVIASAGNHGCNVEDPNAQEVVWRHGRLGTMVYRGPLLNGLAAHPAVLTVGSCQENGQPEAGSNWGEAVGLYARPGLITPWGLFTGTSCAAARVAGRAAQVRANQPGWSAAKVCKVLVAEGYNWEVSGAEGFC